MVVTDERHASAALPGLGSTLDDLDRAIELCRGLRDQLQPLLEMVHEQWDELQTIEVARLAAG